MKIESLKKVIQKNCDIIDAKNGQNYGLCIYLLKMRDYYRWQNAIPLHEELTNEDVHKWIAGVEEYWETIEGLPLLNIDFGDHSFTPFDTEKINSFLLKEGLLYSGGIGFGGIPMFFLSELNSAEKKHGFNILIGGRELSRGLFGSPALFNNETIFIRKETLKYLLWSRYDEWAFCKKDNTLGRAMSYYPFEKDPVGAIDQMTETELMTLIQHEIGEGLLDLEFGHLWRELVLEFVYTKTEILLRAVRDLAADCMTTLPFLLNEERIPSIHLFFANFSDMRKELFPTLYDAYIDWRDTGNSSQLYELIEQGKVFWYDLGKKITHLFEETGKAAQIKIDELIETSRL